MICKERTMSTLEQITHELEQVPEPYLEEILEFIQFIRSKAFREKSALMKMSESALAKNWLTPEEDEAWRDL
jgi:hypothetical protein